jgi:hypothetical protein
VLGIGREPATGNDAMQMGMMEQILAPGVKDREEADLGAQMPGIGRDRAQGFRCGPEQNAVDRLLVLEGDGGHLFGYCKDDVKVLAVQKFGLPVLDPLRTGQGLTFATMTIAAGVIPDTFVAALVALFNVAAQSRGLAYLDRIHDAALCAGHGGVMDLTVGVSVAPEDVRHFQFRAWHGPGA